MKITRKPDMRKRPVNLSLNTELVFQARGYTDNLSLVVESLLAEYIENERRQRAEAVKAAEATAAVWNDFNARHGAFADEYSTL